VLKWAADDFRGRGIDQPRLDAEVLLAFALRSTRVQLIVDAMRPLIPVELARFRELVKRRRTREPVAYLVGEREFYGRTFRVDRRVLVPRPDTETLVEAALRRTAPRALGLRVVDLCTGSGCVGITLARELPTSKVLATDIDEGALVVARENALRLGAYNIGFSRADLYAGLPVYYGGVDLVVSNPPYIPTGDLAGLAADIREYEPRVALDGGPDGLGIVRRVIDEGRRLLRQGGVLAVEVGAGEAPLVRDEFTSRGFERVEVLRDYGKVERVVHGIRC
jgi:release factor glutamine methyltransferase